jgi:hypothetical protein
MEQLRRDQRERHRDAGHQFRAEVVAGVLHAGHQGDDNAGQDSQQQGAPRYSQGGVMMAERRGDRSQVR